MGKANYRNVFDDQSEFEKLNQLILNAIQEFAEYRQGNLTYGEIMFVLEGVLDNMRGTAEKDAKTRIKGLAETPSFGSLYTLVGRLVEIMVKKGTITSDEERFILHGEE